MSERVVGNGVAIDSRRDVVVVGASAGGVEALQALVSQLPATFPAAVLIVLHVPPDSPSALAPILDRAGPLPVREANEDQPLLPGVVLVARPNHHLLVLDGHVGLAQGPQENGHRPAIDVLFRSAARALGPRVIGVVLTGMLDDGAAGLVAVRSQGGLGVVQDPDSALQPGMPVNAIRAAQPDFVLPIDEIAKLLPELVEQHVPAEPATSALVAEEVAMADLDLQAIQHAERPGQPSGISCPDCHGVLFTIAEGGFSRYRCRVGHSWSSQSLLAKQTHAVEGALWIAVRSLEERAVVLRELSLRAEADGRPLSAERFRQSYEETQEAVAMLRDRITDVVSEPPMDEHAEPDVQEAPATSSL